MTKSIQYQNIQIYINQINLKLLIKMSDEIEKLNRRVGRVESELATRQRGPNDPRYQGPHADTHALMDYHTGVISDETYRIIKRMRKLIPGPSGLNNSRF